MLLENDRWRTQDQTLEFWHRQALKYATGSVLDYGCGDGLLLSLLDLPAVGYDISETGIAKTKAKGLNVIPEVTGVYDTVTCLEVLEHTFNPLEILKTLRAHCRGQLLVSTPNFNAVGDRLRVLRGLVPWQKRHGKGHVYWMNHSIFTRLVTDAGFRVVEVVPLGYRQGRSFGGVFDLLARVWPNMFALSFFIRAV